jgi:hypothetical protein
MDGIKINPDAAGRHITELSEEEREKVLGDDKEARESYERCMREGLYHCKRDRCKEAREERERKEKEKDEALCCLQKREEVWVQHAKQQEDKIKRLEANVEKLAGLVAQLLPK